MNAAPFPIHQLASNMSWAIMLGIGIAGVLAIGLIVAVIIAVLLLSKRERKTKLKNSEEAARIDKMFKDGKISEQEAAELKRALGASVCLEPDGSPAPLDIHIKVAAILNAIAAVIDIVPLAFAGITGLLIASFFAIRSDGTAHPPQALALIPIAIIGIVLLLIGSLILLRFMSGLFLLKRSPWARYLTIGLSILCLLSFPIGTAIGAYTLWVLLLRENAAARYDGGI